MKKSFLAACVCFYAFFLYSEVSPEDAFITMLQEKITATTTPNVPAHLAVIATEQATRRLLILDPARDWNTPEAVLWEWNPATAPEIAPEDRHLFGAFSDSKPVLDSTHILTADSAGGVALIRRRDKAVLFYAQAGKNPHSAELLPDGNIVVASSVSSNIVIFAVPPIQDQTQNVTKRVYPLIRAHGVVWDAEGQLLWALGGDELVGYRYNFSKTSPELTRAEVIQLEGDAINGHDLYPVAGTSFMLMTGDGVSLFDKQTRRILPVADVKQVKSLVLSGLNPDDVLMVQITKTDWWSDTIHFFNALRTPVGIRNGAHFYKARFITKTADYGNGGKCTSSFPINTAPEDTYAWSIATGHVFAVEWDYPVGVAQTAMLHVEGLDDFSADYATTNTRQVLSLPADKENIYTLTLVLGGALTKTATVAVVASSGTSSATATCRFSEPDTKPWNRLQRINVLPVLQGTTSLVIDGETLVRWPGGAPCTWYGWGPVSDSQKSYQLALTPFSNVSLYRYPEHSLIMICSNH